MSATKLYSRIVMVLVVALIASACATPTAAPQATAAPVATANPANADKLVGISMPTKTSTRWISDGESMVKSFEALGYKTDLQFADNDINNQLAQIENMVTKGANVLVIAAIDGSTMSDVLQKAHDAGILVISYDRLITKTPNVDYYATFDNFGVGVIQGTQLVTGLGLPDAKGPFNVELFGGSPDDTNAGYFYNGAMSVIQPYIDSGQIVIQSGQMGMDKVGTLRWLAATAQARMDNLLSAYYTDKQVDGVLSPYDGLSIGILSSLKGVGYCTADLPCPVVTGQDAEVASVKSIIAGEQTYTVFKDTRQLAAQTAKMVDQALKGETVDVNDTTTYDNGVKVVPSYLLTPISIDINNYQKELVETGYIKAEDLGVEAPVATDKLVGISMPTKTSTRWISDGESMVKSFEALGYKTDLQFADNDINNQLAQIENMVTKGANVLVIAAIDGSTMSDVLQKAHDAGILVISYDRLITKTPNVDYYATFDNFGVGVIQGTQLVTGLGLPDAKGPFNVELFGGSPDDTNAGYFYNGAMSVIQPYIDSGQIVIQSGQMGMDKVGTLRWLAATAQARMDNLLSAYYTDKQVDGVLSPYDGLSIGILSSLKGVGYCTADLPCPVVTGQDAEVASVKSIIAGEQTYTVFKDTRQLAAQTAKMVDQALKGETVDVNDTTTYDNGVKVVPSYLLTPISIDINNYQKELVDSGYISADDLK